MTKFASLSLLAVMAALGQQPKFEIADVHVSSTAHALGQFPGGAGSVIRDGRYINRDATMLELIREAYGVSEDSIAGGPSWIKSDLFDVIAKVPDGATPETVKPMLQALLADRFRLVIRREPHPMPRYVLSVGDGESKLKRAAPSSDSGCRGEQLPAPAGSTAYAPNVKVTCHNLTSKEIAANFRMMAGGYLDHDVIDATKLEGAWDFEIEWTPAVALSDKNPQSISFFDAVNRQLGIKLALQDVPVPALVIESVNRRPTDNPAGVATALALAAARFEVATIKPANPDQRQLTGLRYAGGSQMQAGGTLRELIALALQIRPNAAADLVIGLPKSADSQRWDITAKLPSTGEGAPNVVRGRPAPVPYSITLEMLRGLLVDQFELKTHSENREVTVYALMVDGAKPKMTQGQDSERSECKVDPMAPRPFPNLGFMVRCNNTSMAQFAQNLEMSTGYLDHPIVDATGLQGGWNFVLGWTPTRLSHNAAPVQAGAAPEAAEPGDVSVFEALQKELGLKLVKQKRSIPVVVVDHVDEKPIE